MQKLNAVLGFCFCVLFLTGLLRYEYAHKSSHSNPQDAHSTAARMNPNSLVGIWQRVEPGSKDDVRTIEFRADGSFADRDNGVLANYDGKINMYTGVGASAATSSGRWSIVSDPSKEPRMDVFGNPIEIPNRDVLLKEDVGGVSPFYYPVIFINANTLTIELEPGRIETYERAQQQHAALQ